MSILADVETQQLIGALGWLFFIAGPFLSIAIGRHVGVFSSKSVVGPERINRSQILMVLSVMLLGLGAWILVPQGYAIYRYRSEMPAQPATQATTQSAITFSGTEMVVLAALAGTAGFLMLVAGHLLLRWRTLGELGLGLGRIGETVPLSLLGIVFILPLLAWVNLITVGLWKLLGREHPQKHDFLRLLDESGSPWFSALLVFSAIVIAPLFEELLFRGHLQTILGNLMDKSRPGRVEEVGESGEAATNVIPYAPVLPPTDQQVRARWMAIVISSLAFSIVHPWWTWPPIFFLSVCLGYAYERTGNLYVPILIHALFNGTSVVLSRFVTV